MATYFTSDSHFWHRNIIELCARPWANVEAMNQALIDNWNSVVGAYDFIYHIGDFSFGDIEKLQSVIRQLNGYKIIVKGNHDRSLKRLMELGFDEAYDQLEYTAGDKDFLMVHNPADAPKLGKYFAVIHGHVHDSWKYARTPEQKLYINAGVDVWDFRPVPLAQMLDECPPYKDIRLIKDMKADADEHRGK